MNDLNTVKRCQTELVTHLYKHFFDQLEDKPTMLEIEIDAAQNDQEQLKRTAACFIPPPIEHHDPSRSKRAVGLFPAAAGVAGLVLGAPVKDAVFSALSVFGLCTNSKGLGKKVDAIMATQQQFCEVLQLVQTKIDETFSLATK